MKKKIILIIVFIIIVFILYFFINYDVKVKKRYELVKISPPIISSMLLDGATDQEIILKIQEDPLSINQKFSECDIPDIKSPLVTAIIKKRAALIKYLIEHGASTEYAVNVLKACPHCKEYLDYFEQVRNDIIIDQSQDKTVTKNSSPPPQAQKDTDCKLKPVSVELRFVVKEGEEYVLYQNAEGQEFKVSGNALIGFDNVVDAIAIYMGKKWFLQVNLDDVGRKDFEEATTNNQGKKIAIIVDDMVVDTPTIYKPIMNGEFFIYIDSEDEAICLMNRVRLSIPSRQGNK